MDRHTDPLGRLPRLSELRAQPGPWEAEPSPQAFSGGVGAPPAASGPQGTDLPLNRTEACAGEKEAAFGRARGLHTGWALTWLDPPTAQPTLPVALPVPGLQSPRHGWASFSSYKEQADLGDRGCDGWMASPIRRAVNLGRLQETVMDREACRALVTGSKKVDTPRND